MNNTVDKIAVLYVYPSDADPASIYKKEDLDTHFKGPIEQFWIEQSYGRYSFEVSVFVWKLPVDKTVTVSDNGHYVVDMLNKVLPDGGDIKVPGFKPDEFSRTIILLGGGVFGFGGGMGVSNLKVNGVEYSNVRVGSFTYFHPNDKYYSPDLRFGYYEKNRPFKGAKSGETMGYPELGLNNEDGTLLHEWGHGLGLSTHANSWNSEKAPLYGNLFWWNKKESLWNQDGDYGNLFDIMGGNPGYSLHINAFYKERLGWVGTGEKEVVTASKKDIRLLPLESQDTGTIKCVQYPVPSNTFTRPAPFMNEADYSFYIEYRQPIGLDKHLGHEYLRSNTEGVLVYLTRKTDIGFAISWLLNMGPDDVFYDNGTPPATATDIMSNQYYRRIDNHKASLNAGRTFYDEQTGFCLTSIRPQASNGVLFDVELGKKQGVVSGVYATALFSGQFMDTSSSGVLYSPDLSYNMKLENGKLVIYNSGNGTGSLVTDTALDRLTFTDGNLAYEKNNGQVWESGTSGNKNAALILGNDGKLRIINNNDGAVIWPKIDLGAGLGAKEILAKVTPEMLQKIADEGMPLYGGDNPPMVEGTYLFNNFKLKSTTNPSAQGVDKIGFQFADLTLTLSDQQAHKITMSYVNGQEQGNGLGSFVVGADKNFTIAAELSTSNNNVPARMILVISGTLNNNGIENAHYANFMLDNSGRDDIWMKNGAGRVIVDIDGVASRV